MGVVGQHDGPLPASHCFREVRRSRESGLKDIIVIGRYCAGLRNLTGLYLPLADAARFYDNSVGSGPLVAHKTREVGLIIHDRVRWAGMTERAA